jgi:adenylyltransferase/sulfurtransferase
MSNVREISVLELEKLRKENADFQLIDVRETDEYNFCNIGGTLIPLNEVEANVNKIDRNKMVIVHCRSGARSGKAIQMLQDQHGFENLYNLRGGILAWAVEIDPTVPRY